VLRTPTQSHPIYTEGPNILAFSPMAWRERLRIEGGLHHFFHGAALPFFMENVSDDPAHFQMIYQAALTSSVSQIQPAPDMGHCATCGAIYVGPAGDRCPKCESNLVSDYGFCQASFTPVSGWALGKRSEWKIRHRSDKRRGVIQSTLPM
jgi:anaerobic ribonucleoside-triphosphate reductase